MLLNLREYHRPADDHAGLQHVLELLAASASAAVLAGGDTLLGSGSSDVEAVVDLQGLGLDGLSMLDEVLRIGAMVTRAALAAEAPQAAGCPLKLLVTGARAWGGNVQRNRATVGGAAAVAAADDPLLAALLACDAEVVLYNREGYQASPLAEYLARRAELLAAPALIAELRVPVSAPITGQAGEGYAGVARTPADLPIVAVCARVVRQGVVCTSARLSATGIAPIPVRLSAIEDALEGQEPVGDAVRTAAAAASAQLEPLGDFRGSADYRRAMAQVLVERAFWAAWADAE